MDAEGHLMGFSEKGEEHKPGWINAGIYLFRHAFLNGITAGDVVSLGRMYFGLYRPWALRLSESWRFPGYWHAGCLCFG
jgi:NDP-sugar pyrophosphorylase family protein